MDKEKSRKSKGSKKPKSMAYRNAVAGYLRHRYYRVFTVPLVPLMQSLRVTATLNLKEAALLVKFANFKYIFTVI